MGPASIGLALLGAAAAAWMVILFVAPPKPSTTTTPTRAHRWSSLRQIVQGRLPEVGGSLFSGLVAYVLIGLVAPAVVIAALGWGATVAYQRFRRVRRSAAIGAALLSAVDLLTQLLPAGHSTRQALTVLAESGPLQLRSEIAQILARLDEISLEESLAEAQLRLRQPLFTLIATTLAVGNRSGGRLTPLLQELSRAAHQIEAVQGQLRAEQAQGRLGALVIAVMPLALLVILHVVNPAYLAPYSTVGGEFLLAGMTGLIVMGYAWMLRILRLPEPNLLQLAPAWEARPMTSANTGPADGVSLRAAPRAGHGRRTKSTSGPREQS